MMMHLLMPAICWLGSHAAVPTPADTLTVPPLAQAPILDGHVTEREYGAPALQVVTAAGAVRVWLGRQGGYVYLAAVIPDSSFYWGDDFVVSLDPHGRGGPQPDAGDRQWYLRRVLDSSVVRLLTAADSGRWWASGQAPPTLGTTRHHADWDIASTSSMSGWTVELRIRESVVKPGTSAPRMALRTYNDRPHGWWSWPVAPPSLAAHGVERAPALWIPLRLP
ncbi:MAG TPA: hypothetical protein VIP11_13395 [Gemmatimonadaceae bacterium]